jgi:hypothetical protein
MLNFNTLFKNQRHVDAYRKLVDEPLPEALVQLQKELEHLDISTLVEPTLENNYPTVKVTASTSENSASAYVVFDSIYSAYGIGVKGGYGLNNFQQAHTAEDAAECVKNKLKSEIGKW